MVVVFKPILINLKVLITNYLPTGDIITTYPINNYDIPVLLVVNKSPYSKLAAIETESTMDYPIPKVLGATKTPGMVDIGAIYNPPGVMAVVNPDYLFSPNGISINLGGNVKMAQIGLGIAHMDFIYTSPFFNFSIIWQALGFGPPRHPFYDIVPEKLRAYCCNNSLPNALPRDQICKNDKADSDQCSTFMNSFCQGDNLLTNQCFNYCDKSNCNTSLTDYCQSDKVDKTSPNYKRTCSCFNTTQFYQDWRNKVFSFLPKDKAELVIKNLPPVKPICDYPDCTTGQSIMPYKSDIRQCPPSQVQICLSHSEVSTGGKMTDSKVDSSSFIQCAQQSGLLPENAGPSPSPSPSPSPTGGSSGGGIKPENVTENASFFQKNKTAVIGVSIITILIVLAIIAYMIHMYR